MNEINSNVCRYEEKSYRPIHCAQYSFDYTNIFCVKAKNCQRIDFHIICNLFKSLPALFKKAILNGEMGSFFLI